MSLLRVTQWPGTVVTVPKALTFPAHVGPDGVIALDDVRFAGPEQFGPTPEYDPWVELPDELYLREFFHLDLSSPAAIAEFVTSYGAFETPWRDIIPVEWTRAASSHEKWFEELIGVSILEIARAEAAEVRKPEQESLGSFMTDSFVLKAQLLRDATRVWLAVAGDRVPRQMRLDWESGWAYAPEAIEQAIPDFFIPLMNQALKPFCLALAVVVEGEPPVVEREYSTYNLLALQMANDIARRAKYHVCENPTCGCVFSRHRGRSQKGRKHTTGIKYCSTVCASRMTSAAYRAKKVADKGSAAT